MSTHLRSICKSTGHPEKNFKLPGGKGTQESLDRAASVIFWSLGIEKCYFGGYIFGSFGNLNYFIVFCSFFKLSIAFIMKILLCHFLGVNLAPCYFFE